jgi:uncharacterized LabA/DUF88 family protein
MISFNGDIKIFSTTQLRQPTAIIKIKLNQEKQTLIFFTMTLIDPNKSRIQAQIQKLEHSNTKTVLDETKPTTIHQEIQPRLPTRTITHHKIADSQKPPLRQMTEPSVQTHAVPQSSQIQKPIVRENTSATRQTQRVTTPTKRPIAPIRKIEPKATISNNNFAFVDCQNLWYNLDKDWQLDWTKFFEFLKTKHGVKRGYVFIGFVAGYQKMYQQLQEAGFILIFKPIQETSNGIKCNIDTEMVLQTMIQLPNYDRAVIVSGDGDFTCLVDYLVSVKKLEAVLIPGQKSYSHSLEKAGKDKVIFISKLKNILAKDAAAEDDMPMIISE